MEIVNKILKWIKENPTFFLLIVCVILILLLVQQCKQKNYYKNINDNNIAYYTDSLRQERNKVGDLEFKHNILLTDIDRLKDSNKELFDELQKEKNKVKIIIKWKTKIVHDTIPVHDTIIKNPDGSFTLKWDYNKVYTTDGSNFQTLEGNSIFKLDTTVKPFKPISLGTLLTKNEIGFDIVTGIEKNKETGQLQIFVRSHYPGFNITKLDGAIVDPSMFGKDNEKTKSFGIGPSIGVGINQKFEPMIYIGVGLHWNIMKF